MKTFKIRSAKDIGIMLQGYRKKKGITQKELAQSLGLTQQTVSSMERNGTNVTIETLLHVLSVLQVDCLLQERESVTVTPPLKENSTGDNW